MRIIDTYGKFNGPAVESARQGARANGAAKTSADDATASTSSGTDAVTVSAKALELAHSAAKGADDAKIEQLRSSIQDGTFKVDRQAIAKRLVEGG